jgi:hypothetical protein
VRSSGHEIIHLDTNLLLLLVVGGVHREQVGRHKRLRAYLPEDFDTLVSALQGAKLSFCPNVFTETSNLFGRQGADSYNEFLLEIAQNECETFVESKTAGQRFEFQRLGLTDAVLLEMARSGGTLLTSDADLHWAAESAGYKSVNFNHLRRI